MIIEELHRRFENMQDLRAREIRVDKQQRRVFCALSYPNISSITATEKNAIIAFVKTLIPQGYSCSVSFANDRFTELSFEKLLSDVLHKKFPIFSVLTQCAEVKIVEREITLKFHVNAVMEKNIEAAELIERLTEFFVVYTCYNVRLFVVLEKAEIVKANLAEQEKLAHLAINRELLKPSRYFIVSDVVKHIGKTILSSPMYIADIRKPSDSYVICGTVSNKTLKASKNDPNMYICKFMLSDASGGSIPCVVFTRFDVSDYKTIKETMGKTDSEALTISRTRALANDKKMKKMMDIYDSMSVIVRGKVTFNNFSEQLEMCVYDLCKCNIVSNGNAAQFNRSLPREYSLVKPEIYKDYLQTSFMDADKLNRSPLSGKSYVVLHANVTGYNVIKDKIIAICGVKIVDGRITEKIFSYVNPETDIDAGVLEQAKVSVDKLVFYPTITELIPDIAKFIDGCVLTGLDTPKVMEIINYYASPVGYKFTNSFEQQGDIFSVLFDTSGYSHKPVCSKIEDVSKQCRISLASNTFCQDTAVTTAQCMVMLSNRSK